MRLIPALLAILLALPAYAAEDAALQHARKLLASTVLIDGHNDLPELIRNYGPAPGNIDAYDLRRPTQDETDIARLRSGMLGAQFWSVYVPGELDSGWAHEQLEQIELTRRMLAKYPEVFLPATRSEDIARARRQHKIASFMGIEGGHVIENSLGALRAYYELGVRYMTLTHNVTLDWADAALDTPTHHGLTPFGKEVVREMNRLGMLVDLAHVSPEVMADALDVSEAPVIFSHSSTRALTDHPRNVPDAILKRLAANGGVIMLSFVPPFVSQEGAAWSLGLAARQKGVKDAAERARIEADYIRQAGPRPQASLQQVADHIEHAAQVAGHEHIGIGADFCGIPMPAGLKDVASYPALFAELIRRGWSDADLRKLAGENLVRALRQAETVAARLQKTRRPSTATISQLDGKGAPQSVR